jgi:hypothetical protein
MQKLRDLALQSPAMCGLGNLESESPVSLDDDRASLGNGDIPASHLSTASP